MLPRLTHPSRFTAVFVAYFIWRALPLLCQEQVTEKGTTLANTDTTTQTVSTITTEFPRHYIGISASSFSGVGVSYRYDVTQVIQLRITGFGFVKSTENPGGISIRETTLGFGGELIYTVKTFDGIRLYLLAGGNRFYESSAFVRKVRRDELTLSNEHWRFGAGFGAEFRVFQVFFISVDLGAINESLSRFNIAALPQNIKESALGLGLGLGLAYGF